MEGWMPDADWRACTGDVRLRTDEPVYACVRVAHDHRTAAVAAAQREGERVVVSMRTFGAPEGEYVQAAAIERHLRDLHARYPARVIASLPSYWTDPGPEGRQALASALFTKLEVEGYRKMRYELTPDAIDLGLSAALPAQLETGGQMGGFGRGERI
jgi:hypothetical protein